MTISVTITAATTSSEARALRTARVAKRGEELGRDLAARLRLRERELEHLAMRQEDGGHQHAHREEEQEPPVVRAGQRLPERPRRQEPQDDHGERAGITIRRSKCPPSVTSSSSVRRSPADRARAIVTFRPSSPATNQNAAATCNRTHSSIAGRCCQSERSGASNTGR